MNRLAFLAGILVILTINNTTSIVFANNSIMQWFSKESGSDIELLKLAEAELKSGKYESALGKANRIITAQRYKNDIQAQALANLIKALCYYYKEENERAIAAFSKTLEYSEKLNDPTITLRALDKYGLSYYWIGKYDEASKILEKGFALASKNNMQLYVSIFYENRGRVYKAINETDKAIYMFEKSLKIKIENNFLENLDNTHNQLGIIYYNRGEYEKAIEHYNESLKITEGNNDELGKGICFNNIGNVYRKWGNYEKAIESLQKATKIFEELKIPGDVANCLNNLGVCYENLMEENLPSENIKNLQTALQYHEQALQKRKELGDSLGIGNSYINLGNVYSGIVVYTFMIEFGKDSVMNYYLKMPPDTILKEYKKALDYYNLAMPLKRKINDYTNISGLLNNIGRIYVKAGMFDKAMRQFNEALSVAIKAGDKYQEALNYREIGQLYQEKHDNQNALHFLILSNNLSIAYDFPFLKRYNYQDLSRVYESIGNTDEAFKNYKKYIEVKDLIVNEEKYKQMAFLVTKYETDKKESEIKLLKTDQLAKANQMKYMRRTIWLISFAGLVFIVLSLMLFKLFKDKQKANIELEQKNNLITEQNDALEKQNELITQQKEEITDSIKYASKIQTAIIPNKTILDKLLKDYFVLFQPRDIVSGDFYYATSYNGQIIIAAADCTGHGVPGAFMSMLGITSIKEIIKSDTHLSASNLLNKLREYIINSFQQDQEKESDKRKDGMDIGLLIINPEKSKMQFAGAFNGAILIRNSEITEIEADHMPVGAYDELLPFTNKELDCYSGDVIYLFSDGYSDQFGGPSEKKFMYKNFKKLLLEIHNEPMETQKNILWQKHIDWRGDIGQIDDILVMGIRLNTC